MIKKIFFFIIMNLEKNIVINLEDGRIRMLWVIIFVELPVTYLIRLVKFSNKFSLIEIISYSLNLFMIILLFWISCHLNLSYQFYSFFHDSTFYCPVQSFFVSKERWGIKLTSFYQIVFVSFLLQSWIFHLILNYWRACK